jgi:hypothetical protein
MLNQPEPNIGVGRAEHSERVSPQTQRQFAWDRTVRSRAGLIARPRRTVLECAGKIRPPHPKLLRLPRLAFLPCRAGRGRPPGSTGAPRTCGL